MNPPWTMHNIKLNSTDSHRMAFGKLTLNRKKDTWQVDFTGFTTAPITGEMWMVGDGARLVFDMAAKSGNMAYHKHLSMPKWENFIYSARSVVVSTSKKLLMLGNMPGREPLNEMAIQTMIMAARRGEKPMTKVDVPKELPKTKGIKPAPKLLPVEPPKVEEEIVKVAHVAEALSAELDKVVPTPEPTEKKVSIEKPKFERITTQATDIKPKMEEKPKVKVKAAKPEVIKEKPEVRHEKPEVKGLKIETEEKKPEVKEVRPKTIEEKPETNEEKALPPVIEPMLHGVPMDKVTIIDLKGDKKTEDKTKTPVVDTKQEKIEDMQVETKEDKLKAKIASIEAMPVKKAAEKLEQATAKSEEEHEKGEEIKKMLSREPLDRVMPPIKEFKMPEEEEKLPAKLLPVNWDIEHIKEALKGAPCRPPFAGTFNGSKFVRVEVAKAMGFNHIMVGEVPLGKLPVYMLCVPGSAARPPIGLPQFNRWIPARGGGGYWVKYLTPAPNSVKGRREW